MIENECLCCGRKLRLECSLVEMLYVDDVVCRKCRFELGYYPKRIEIVGHKVKGFYPYEGFVRDIMIQYKEYNDEALKSVFLYKRMKSLQKKYRDYVIVPAPSSQKSLERRGFHQVEEMIDILRLPIRRVLIKREDIDQKQLNYQDRKKIAEVIQLTDLQSIKGRKVLLVDDILTSGNTLKACLKQLEPYCAKIDILVVCYNKRYLTKLDRLIRRAKL